VALEHRVLLADNWRSFGIVLHDGGEKADECDSPALSFPLVGFIAIKQKGAAGWPRLCFSF
jgi:hypothetical protein